MLPPDLLEMYNVWPLISFAVALCVAKLIQDFFWTPRRLLRIYRRQGIKGPIPSLVVGNLPQIREFAENVSRSGSSSTLEQQHGDVVAKVLPFYPNWSTTYGETFLLWWGTQPKLMISDPEMIKEVLCDNTGSFDRDTVGQQMRTAKDLFGQGVPMLRMNQLWARKRKMVSTAFHTDKLKMMIDMMAACVEDNINGWNVISDDQLDIDVASKLKDMTADVICQTAFGTSYAAGKKVFELQLEQQFIHLEWQGSLHLPGFRFLPIAKNRQRWMLKKKINNLLRDMVLNRMKERGSNGYGNDLLGLLLSAEEGTLASSKLVKIDTKITMQDIIDECKSFFFTGHETSASLLGWTLLLLALNPEYQERVREELQQAASAKISLETLNDLKFMTMVLHEALRMYSPAPVLTRYAHKDAKLKELHVSKGTGLLLPLIAMNYNEKIWGADVNEFNPYRFDLSKQENQQRVFIPFSIGPRTCIGQNFAMIESKIILSKLLLKFKFHMSDSYVHSPFQVLTLQPRFGIPMKLTRV